MTTDPLARLVVALVAELRTVVRDEVRAAMATRAPTEVVSVREAAAFARVGQARIRAWVATGRLARCEAVACLRCELRPGVVVALRREEG